MARLSLATLSGLPASLRPQLDPSGLRVGIVHLGLGAFHRAHQAVFTEEAMAAVGDAGWGICGVTQRSTAVVNQLRPQDCLYSVLQRDAHTESVRVVGSVREVLYAADNYESLLARIADPDIRIVSLTVTEKGYRHDPASGRLRLDDAEIAADLAGRPARTVVGQLVRGLAARRSADVGPLAVMSCDNLPSNGATLRGLVREFADRCDPGLTDWISGNVSFPSTMVDRIVPATTAVELARAAELLGVRDEGVVVTEPFRQWVIEDDFPAGRPDWAAVGAILTDDVAPYEVVKLRLLNGSHSMLAYLGALSGATYAAEAVAHDDLREALAWLMAEVTPTLTVPAGFDLPAYQRSLLDRFANPALRHRVLQIAMDGSQKLPQRLLEPARALRSAGRDPYWIALAVAAWMRYAAAGVTDDGVPVPLDDPLADRLRAVTQHARGSAAVVDGLLSLTDVFGGELSQDTVFRASVLEHYGRLAADGVHAAVKAALRDVS